MQKKKKEDWEWVMHPLKFYVWGMYISTRYRCVLRGHKHHFSVTDNVTKRREMMYTRNLYYLALKIEYKQENPLWYKNTGLKTKSDEASGS